MLPQSFAPWVRITRIRPTHHARSRDGSSTFQTKTLGDHPRAEEEDHHHHTPQDHPQEVVEEEEVVEVEAVEGHFHYPDTRRPHQLKNF